MADRTLRLAHRGDWRSARENTLAALLAGARLPGCDGVEFDVRVSSDGEPVILHDETLDRIQGVAARPGELTAAKLAQLEVPRLSEVLAALPHSAVLDVDVKEDLGRKGVEILASGRGPDLSNAMVSSFVPAILASFRRLAPGWPLWLNAADLSPGTIELAVGLDCRGISAEWHAIDRRSLRLAVAAGLEVAAWTVRRGSTYRRLASLGVATIIVEGPALEEPAPVIDHRR
jgi:glycerophosphoryl diester phosphodiesterase